MSDAPKKSGFYNKAGSYRHYDYIGCACFFGHFKPHKKSAHDHLTFVTATDGNHGRAVAWAAKLFGCKSVVYMPKGSSLVRLEAINLVQENLPTHVFVQAGVGSFAAAIVASLVSLAEGAAPKFIVVEPEGAPCLFESIKKGERVRIKGDLATIMAGLSCGEPGLPWQRVC